MKKSQEIVDSCNEFIDIIDKNIIDLWQGKGCNVQEIVSEICTFSGMVIQQHDDVVKSGIDFPMDYVSGAMVHTDDAIQARDDYKLADNLYYEWREIAIVFGELYDTCGELEMV